MLKITPLHRGCLIRCGDDSTGLWEILREVQRAYPDADEGQVREYALRVLEDLLSARYILAGDVDLGTGKFTAWDLPANQIMERVRQEWNDLGREPNIWEIVWFVSTVEGDRALAEGKDPNSLNESEENRSDQA